MQQVSGGTAEQYRYAHALMRDAIYDSLLRSERVAVHKRAAEALQSPGAIVAPEAIAHHLTEAGEHEEAIAFWLQAARQATESYGNAEARQYVSRGLALLHGVRPTHRRQVEQALWLASIGPTQALFGFGASEVIEVHEAALAVTDKTVEPETYLSVLPGIIQARNLNGPLPTDDDLAELLSVGSDVGSIEARVIAGRVAGSSLYLRGQFSASVRQLKESLELLSNATQAIATVGQYAPVLDTLRNYSLSLDCIGLRDQASAHIEDGVASARSLGVPFHLASTLTFALSNGVRRKEYRRTLERLSEVEDLSNEFGFDQWRAGAKMIQGSCRTMIGQVDEGLRDLRLGLDAWLSVAGQTWYAYWLTHYAAGLLVARRYDEGLEELARVITIGDETRAHHVRAEAHRLNAIAYSRMGGEHRSLAGPEFKHALAVAREQGALLYELRAASDWLIELPESSEIARPHLSNAYDQFTEGFDTEDLLTAQALLQNAS